MKREKKKKKSNDKLVNLGKRGFYHKNNKLNNLTGKEWVKFTKSWEFLELENKDSFFIINPKARKEDVVLHPAKYPEELVIKIINFFTKKGQIVFDPFLGTGSTLVAARETKRKGIGIELIKKYADVSRKRLGNDLNKRHFVFNGDSRKMFELKNEKGLTIQDVLKKLERKTIDLVVCSPPYWDMLKRTRGHIKSAHKQHIEKCRDSHYSELKEDLGNIQDYEEYIGVLLDIFHKCSNILKKGGYLVIVLQNIRTPDGEMKPLAWDLGIRLSNKYVLQQEKLWLQNNKSLFCWGYPSTYVSNVHHHYCLVLRNKK
jgi:DNA modification methylase